MDRTSPYLLKLPPSIQNLIQLIAASGVVEKIVLFGSRARETFRENSDFDFAVWITDRRKWSEFSADLDRKTVTLLPYDLVIYDELSEDYQRQIDAEGIVIYE